MTSFGKNNVQARGLFCSNMTHFWLVICYKERALGETLQSKIPLAVLFVSVDMQKKKNNGGTDKRQVREKSMSLTLLCTYMIFM